MKRFIPLLLIMSVFEASAQSAAFPNLTLRVAGSNVFGVSDAILGQVYDASKVAVTQSCYHIAHARCGASAPSISHDSITNNLTIDQYRCVIDGFTDVAALRDLSVDQRRASEQRDSERACFTRLERMMLEATSISTFSREDRRQIASSCRSDNARYCTSNRAQALAGGTDVNIPCLYQNYLYGGASRLTQPCGAKFTQYLPQSRRENANGFGVIEGVETVK